MLILLSVVFAQAQVYTASETSVRFFSDAPIIDIEAVSRMATASLNIEKKEVFIEIPINSFAFKKAMMQTNFNEKYMESKRYPNARFKGKLNNLPSFDTDGIYKVNFVGRLNLHGVERPLTIPCTFTVKKSKITFQTEFAVKSADYKIAAPDVIYRKVGEEVRIEVSGVLVD